MWNTSQETLVVIRVEIVSGLMEAFEAPAIELSCERFELALREEFGHHLTDE
jgi:hypothetical protein